MSVIKDGDTNGIDDVNSSVISKEKAYELASKELLAANQIGDTEGKAEVTNKAGKQIDLTNK